MADGVRLDAGDDDAERAALGDEARLIRRVRWRLVAWSGLSTLVVLLVLGAALYAVTASTLSGASIDQLENRVDPWVARLTGEDPDGNGGGDFGFEPGAGNTFLFLFDDAGRPVQLGERRVVVLDGAARGRQPRRGAHGVGRTRRADGRRDRTSRPPFADPAPDPARDRRPRRQRPTSLQALQDRSTEVARSTRCS